MVNTCPDHDTSINTRMIIRLFPHGLTKPHKIIHNSQDVRIINITEVATTIHMTHIRVLFYTGAIDVSVR